MKIKESVLQIKSYLTQMFISKGGSEKEPLVLEEIKPAHRVLQREPYGVEPSAIYKRHEGSLFCNMHEQRGRFPIWGYELYLERPDVAEDLFAIAADHSFINYIQRSSSRLDMKCDIDDDYLKGLNKCEFYAFSLLGVLSYSFGKEGAVSILKKNRHIASISLLDLLYLVWVSPGQYSAINMQSTIVINVLMGQAKWQKDVPFSIGLLEGINSVVCDEHEAEKMLNTAQHLINNHQERNYCVH